MRQVFYVNTNHGSDIPKKVFINGTWSALKHLLSIWDRDPELLPEKGGRITVETPLSNLTITQNGKSEFRVVQTGPNRLAKQLRRIRQKSNF